jgi:single-strand DNA-binding protein
MSIKVYIAGHLGDQPKNRVIATGVSAGQELISFSVATKVRRAGQEETVWWNVTVWPDRAHMKGILKFLKKGSGVIVTGEMGKPRTYVDKEGQTQVALDLVADSISFSPFGKTDGVATGQETQQTQSASAAQGPFEGAFAFQHAAAPASAGVGAPAFGQGAENSGADSDDIPF